MVFRPSQLWKYLGITGLSTVVCHMILTFIFPEIVYALTPVEVFDSTINKSQYAYNDIGSGQYGFVTLLLTYARFFKQIVMAVAVILITVEGYMLIVAEGDAAVLKKSGTSIIWLLAGIIVMQMAETVVSVFWKVNGVYGAIDPVDKQIPLDFQNKILLPLLSFGILAEEALAFSETAVVEHHAIATRNLTGAAPAEPDTLLRLYDLFVGIGHPLAADLRREAADLGLSLQRQSATPACTTPDEHRDPEQPARLFGHLRGPPSGTV